MPEVRRQADEDGRSGADPLRQPAEEVGKRDTDKLHQGDRRDHGGARDADFLPVNGGHPDDGADAIVVDQERQQQQEGLPVSAELPEGGAEATE